MLTMFIGTDNKLAGVVIPVVKRPCVYVTPDVRHNPRLTCVVDTYKKWY